MNNRGKVLFIIHDAYQEDNNFPSGPAYLAAMLKSKGAEVTVCCQDVFHYSDQTVVDNYLRNGEYDIIGIGFLAARFKETVKGLCNRIAENKRGAWLVLGGHGPASIPEYMLKATGADVVITGEAEETIVELLECKISGGNDINRVQGIAFRKASEIIINEHRKPVNDLDRLYFPTWDLFPMDKYSNCFKFQGMDENDKALGIVTSRGCMYSCSFCYRMERGIRFRGIENVVQEIKLLRGKYGITYFIIQDELFIASKKRLIELRDQLNKNELSIKFDCNARVDIFDEEIADYLKECGCVLVNFGFESSDQNVLNLMNKRTAVEQNIKAARIAKKAGLGMGLNFMWGNIGDTEKSLRENVKLIKELNTYYQLRTIRPVTPYPGCDLYYEAIKRFLLSGPEDFFEKFKNSDLLTVNFTEIPDKTFYELLFEANKELILDHYKHTFGKIEEANALIKQFYDLYFQGNYRFRGSRHYDKKINPGEIGVTH